MGEKWYNSGFFSYIGQGVGLAAVFFGMCYGVRGCSGPSDNEVIIEREKAESAIQPAEVDLNNDGRKEEFVEVNGKLYFRIMDGDNLEDRVLKRGIKD